jgi:membrane-associated phospholipid phosphatase
VLWTACLAAVLLLLTLAVGTGWTPLASLDQRVADAAYGATHGHAGRVDAWTLVTDAGGPPYARGLLVAVGVGLLLLRRVRLGLWLVALAVVEGVVAPAAKTLLDRPRPTWADPITSAPSSSYPSGHATAAFTVAVALALLTWRLSRTAAVRATVLVVAGAGAVAVAASRVLLGVHYLSDVVGGALLGALLAVASLLVALAPRPGRSGSSRRTRRTVQRRSTPRSGGASG